MAAQNRNRKVKRLALMGLLFALAMALSFLEALLPALPMLPPGIRLGLSNIVTMYALFVLGPVSGYTIAVLKSLFVLLTRGAARPAGSPRSRSCCCSACCRAFAGSICCSAFSAARHTMWASSSRPGSSSAINMFGTTCRFF